MSTHTPDREPKQRIPLELRGGDILLLLRLKHELENETGKVLKTNDVIRTALRELASRRGITA